MAEWFPKRERAFATGIFNSGTNIGALVTPLVVPWITLTLRLVLGVHRHRRDRVRLARCSGGRCTTDPERIRASSAARAGAHPQRSAGADRARAVARRCCAHRQTWAFAVGKFMTDPIWWLYLFWIPDFLNRNHGIDLRTGRPAADRHLSGRRRRQHRRRLAVVDADQARLERQRRRGRPRCSSARSRSCRWSSRRAPRACGSRSALISLAAAAHQGWSANLFTLASDMFPRQAVGSVVGFGGMAGAVGGMLIAKLTGYLLEATGSYVPVFLMAAFAYLVALAVIHLLVPRLEPARLDIR